jgi:beta-galactosidase/beta-glucuronidase
VEQGEDYDGTAWYRLKFRAPGFEGAGSIYLAFGAADESAKVWLNGKLIGEHDIGDIGWNVPFKLDVTGKLKPDMENVLAVRVFDISGGGGLWKSVKVMMKGPRPVGRGPRH